MSESEIWATGRILLSVTYDTHALLLSEKLPSYPADINRQAQGMMDTIIQQMAEAQGITEALIAADQKTWVGKMNNIRASAVGIVNTEIISV